MKKLLGLAVPFLGQLQAARAWLTLIVVAGAAAFLYWKFATVARERDQLRGFAAVACATAGAPFDASVDQVQGADGKLRTVKRKRGELCQARMLALAAFERDATKASNRALAGALEQHATKSEADASAAASNAAAAVSAARRMEQAENDVPQDDRVGRDWFDALNELAGLQPRGG